MKRFIENLLESDGGWLIVRLLLLVIFISSGLAKLFDFEGSLAEMRAAGLHPDWLFNIASALVCDGAYLLAFLWRRRQNLTVFCA